MKRQFTKKFLKANKTIERYSISLDSKHSKLYKILKQWDIVTAHQTGRNF